MVDRISHFARYVLHQSSVLMDVQNLRAITDRQYGLALCERVIEQPAIGMLASFVGILVLCMRGAAKPPRLYVRRTAREYETIERLR